MKFSKYIFFAIIAFTPALLLTGTTHATQKSTAAALPGYPLISGAEKDYRVPVRMHLTAGKKLQVRHDGAFDLAAADLAANNSVVDSSTDNLDTIDYVAKAYIKSLFHGQTIHFKSPQINWFINGAETAADGKGKIQAGGYSAIFQVADKPRQIKKLQLAKKNGKWQVVRELQATQIYSAHSLTAPFLNKPPYIFEPIAARHFEKHFYNAEGGWKKIKEPRHIMCDGGNRPGQQGFCEVDYGRFYKGKFKINNSYQRVKCTAKTYLFIKKSGKWVIDKILPVEKRFDLRKNKVVDRKRDVWTC